MALKLCATQLSTLRFSELDSRPSSSSPSYRHALFAPRRTGGTSRRRRRGGGGGEEGSLSHHAFDLATPHHHVFFRLRSLPEQQALPDASSRSKASQEEEEVLNPSSSRKTSREDKEAAAKALSMVLSEQGLSEEDAAFISSKAPSVVQSFIDAAYELDELAGWSAELRFVDTESTLVRRVYEVAKGSHGQLVAGLVESIGVEQSSISRVSHILSSQKLPDLLDKIEFLRDLLSENKDNGVTIRVGRMMREMSLSADENLQKTFSFFEKMEARQNGMNALNSSRDAVAFLVEGFPEALTRCLNSDLRTLVAYLEETGVPKDQVGSVVMCYPSILIGGSIKQFQFRLQKLKKVGLKPSEFGKMLIKYPWILSRTIENNVEDLTEFLEYLRVPKGKIGRCIAKCPNLLGSSSIMVQQSVECMRLMGVPEKELSHAVAHSPQLLLKPTHGINEVCTFFQGLGVEGQDLIRIFVRSPELFASTVPFLKSKVAYLKKMGIRGLRLKNVVLKYPPVLMMSVENSIKPRVAFLESMGLSKEDVSCMISRFPPVLGYSIDRVLRPKFDFLRNVICHPLNEAVLYPKYFSYCLKKKIMPRYRVLKHLNVEFDLKSMLSQSDEDFASKHLGLGHMLVPPV